MQKSWKGKNVDLALFTAHVGEFFKARDFEAVKGEIPNGYQIFAEDSPYFKMNGYVSVTVEGRPDDFVVKYDLCTSKGKRAFHYLSFLETMLFGGFFLSRRLKSEEDRLRLEKEFWRHVENVVLRLSNSAEPSVYSSE